MSSYAGVRSTRESIAVLSNTSARTSATLQTMISAIESLNTSVTALADELDKLKADIETLKAKAAQGLWTP